MSDTKSAFENKISFSLCVILSSSSYSGCIRRIWYDETSMRWYHYLATIAAGFFLANIFPHFISGVTGQAFPSPFANPPGVGLSSPTVNVLWGLANLILSYILLRASKASFGDSKAMFAFFVGIAICSLLLSTFFGANSNI